MTKEQQYYISSKNKGIKLLLTAKFYYIYNLHRSNEQNTARLFSQWWCVHTKYFKSNDHCKSLTTSWGLGFFCLFGDFNAPFFIYHTLKYILFLSQCGIGSFGSQSNTVPLSLNENIPLHLRKLRITTSMEARRIYLRNITTCTYCSFILP